MVQGEVQRGGEEVQKLAPDDLESHPKNPDFHADQDRPEIDAEEVGEFRQNPKVTAGSHFTDANWTIISGHRRAETAKHRSWEEVVVDVVGPYQSKEEERRAVLEYNEHRMMTPGEKVNYAFGWLEVWHGGPLENLPQDKDTREKLDGLFKERDRTIEKGLKVKWAAETGVWEGQELAAAPKRVARNQWQLMLDDEATFHGAHKEVKKAHEEAESEPGDTPEPRGGISDFEIPEEELESHGLNEPVQAAFEVSTKNLSRLLKVSTLSKTLQRKASDGGPHPFIHLKFTERGVQTETATAGEVISAQYKYGTDFFDEFEFNRTEPVGVSVHTDDLQGHASVLGRTVRVEIRGPDDAELASGGILTDGSIHSWVLAPDERDSFKNVPDWLPERDVE